MSKNSFSINTVWLLLYSSIFLLMSLFFNGCGCEDTDPSTKSSASEKDEPNIIVRKGSITNTNNQKVHYNNDSFGGYTYIGMNPLLNYQFDILLISNFFHSNYHS